MNNKLQLFLLCGGGMAASCLATMNWKMLAFRKVGIPSPNMVVCSFVSLCVHIPHDHGDFLIITKPCIRKVLVTNYHLTLL